MANTFCTAYDGERWDQVAVRAYGDAGKMNMLLAANPDMGIADRLAGGTVINVPVIDGVSVAPDANLLPPWKRL